MLHNQLCIVKRFSFLKWWIEFEFLDMSLAFDWLQSNVAKASWVLAVTPAEEHAGLWQDGPPQSFMKTSANTGFLLDQSLCPSDAAEQCSHHGHGHRGQVPGGAGGGGGLGGTRAGCPHGGVGGNSGGGA